MIGSARSFHTETCFYLCICSECSRKIERGDTCLVSRAGRRVHKRVCSEACRQTFDDRYWQGRANDRAWRGRP